MKKIITLCASAFLGLSSTLATIITVSNNSNTPGQYSNLQTAINNANSGDSIYVHGSSTNYGAITINKPGLSLIGTGHQPQKDFPFVSSLTDVTFDTIQYVSRGRNCKIIGLNLNSIGNATSVNGLVTTVAIDRCKIGTLSIGGSNWVVTRCIINGGTYPNNNNNIVLSNNMFFSNLDGTGNSPTSVLISNNIFMCQNGVSMREIDNATIQNNIFYKSSPSWPYYDFSGCQNNTFNNNIAFLLGDNTLPPAGNSGANNFGAANATGIDPKFVAVPIGNATFNYSYDYHLRSTAPISPGRNAGTDGTDIGIYGGAYPWIDMTGTPPIPQVKTFNVLNPSVNAGTPVNISVKAKKQN
ncbi:MAG: hypothetical protein K0S44_478 [Bacteroidetes bacterium]|jgi:hypothetical protein|nr:hypothetical protein [Bacteroidota bacterium]